MNISAILRQRCPRCRRGRMFHSPLGMHSHCPECDLDFEREEGYYTGAMVTNYVMATVLIMPLWLVMVLTGMDFWMSIGVVAVLLVVLVPVFFRISRAIWLHVDFSLDAGTRDHSSTTPPAP